MDRKPRHLIAIESIDAGLRAAEQVTIEDGIREAIKAGRMSEDEGAACIHAYRAARLGAKVIELRPDIPDGAA